MTSRRLIAFLAALVCAACSAHHPVPPRSSVTGAAAPKTVQQLCDAQTWPRPVPNVVGRLLYQAKDGALECYQLKSVAPDGHDPLNHPARPAEKTYRIVAVSPATGTPVGRGDAVTVELAEVDPTEPPAFRPCDWVTATEAAGIMGGPVNAEPLGAEPGSVDIACIYDKPHDVGDGVEVDLQTSGAFAVDASSEFALATGTGDAVDGIGLKAACVNELTTTPPSTTLVVLLSGERILRVTQGFGSCANLKRFAQVAIGRID